MIGCGFRYRCACPVVCRRSGKGCGSCFECGEVMRDIVNIVAKYFDIFCRFSATRTLLALRYSGGAHLLVSNKSVSLYLRLLPRHAYTVPHRSRVTPGGCDRSEATNSSSLPRPTNAQSLFLSTHPLPIKPPHVTFIALRTSLAPSQPSPGPHPPRPPSHRNRRNSNTMVFFSAPTTGSVNIIGASLALPPSRKPPAAPLTFSPFSPFSPSPPPALPTEQFGKFHSVRPAGLSIIIPCLGQYKVRPPPVRAHFPPSPPPPPKPDLYPHNFPSSFF